MTKQLLRPKKGRVLFGVAQGLGNYFEIDPIIFRILFILFTVWGGAGVLLYIIGIFLIPDEKANSVKEEIEDIKANKDEIKNKAHKRAEAVAEEVKIATKKRNQSSIFIGLLVVLIGLIFLFSNFISWLSFSKLWPIILIFFGLLIIANTQKE